MTLPRRKTTTGLLLAAAIAAAGCAGGESAADRAAAQDAVAVVGGETITAADLVQRLQTEQYDMLRATVDGMISERVVQDEAAARGVSTAELLQTEVEQKVGPPDAGEVEALYEQYRDSPGMRGRSLEEMQPQIESFLRRQKLVDRRNDR